MSPYNLQLPGVSKKPIRFLLVTNSILTLIMEENPSCITKLIYFCFFYNTQSVHFLETNKTWKVSVMNCLLIKNNDGAVDGGTTCFPCE